MKHEVLSHFRKLSTSLSQSTKISEDGYCSTLISVLLIMQKREFSETRVSQPLPVFQQAGEIKAHYL